MDNVQGHHSEVASLLQQIREEHEASVSAMKAFASGTLQHKIINRRWARICELQEQVQDLVGDIPGTTLVDQQLQGGCDVHHSSGKSRYYF